MAGGIEPKTDRELIISLSGQIENLAHSIDEFGNKLLKLEEGKVAEHDKRLLKIENRNLRQDGAIRLVAIIWSVLTGIGIVAIIGFVNYLFKR